LNCIIIDDAGDRRRCGADEWPSWRDGMRPPLPPALAARIGPSRSPKFAAAAANEKGEAEAPPFHNLGLIRNYWITRVVLWLKLAP